VKILVTGGAGFIGSSLSDKLVALGHKVSIIDNLSTGKIENVNDKAKLYIANIEDKNISKIFESQKFDIVYHLAAQIDVQESINNPVYDADVNILGTINILENSRRHGVRKIIYSSSAAIYGEPEYLGIDEKHKSNPISYYGISKYVPENYIKTYSKLWKIDYSILRYANVYGIRQDPKGEGGVISIFMDRMFKNNPVTIYGNGFSTRDFIYVEDVVDANIKVLDKGSRQIFNIGTGTATNINTLYTTMNKIMDKIIEVSHLKERKGDILHSYFNVEKAKKVLGWEAKHSLEHGLTKTIEYYEKQSDDALDYVAISTS